MIGQNCVNLSCCVTTIMMCNYPIVSDHRLRTANEKWWSQNQGLKITNVAANWTLFMAVLYVKF